MNVIPMSVMAAVITMIPATATATTEPPNEALDEKLAEIEAYHTDLGDAVVACVTGESDHLPADAERMDIGDYLVMDAGHSALIYRLGAFECLIGELGLPDWLWLQVSRTDEHLIVWNTVTVDGYTTTWTGEAIIMFDETVS